MGLKEFGYAFAFLILTAMFGGMLYFAFTYLGGGAAGIAFFALPLGVCCFGAFIFFCVARIAWITNFIHNTKKNNHPRLHTKE